MRQLLLFLAAASSAVKVAQLPPKTSCSSGEETTLEPETTEDPLTEEPTSTEEYDTTTTCPLGWIDDGKLGCFLFAPQMAGLTWIEALEYCEEQVQLLAVNLEKYSFEGRFFG